MPWDRVDHKEKGYEIWTSDYSFADRFELYE